MRTALAGRRVIPGGRLAAKAGRASVSRLSSRSSSGGPRALHGEGKSEGKSEAHPKQRGAEGQCGMSLGSLPGRAARATVGLRVSFSMAYIRPILRELEIIPYMVQT